MNQNATPSPSARWYLASRPATWLECLGYGYPLVAHAARVRGAPHAREPCALRASANRS